MRSTASAKDLINSSEKYFEEFHFLPPKIAPKSVQEIFPIGGRWMKKILRRLEKRPLPRQNPCFQDLGYFKYGFAVWTAFITLCLFSPLGIPIASLTAFLAFYAVEAQMVFLFPLAIEGAPNPLYQSFLETRRAGGTVKVMATVMFIAVYMVSGIFRMASWKRTWCIGCLAVLLWHVRLKKARNSHENL